MQTTWSENNWFDNNKSIKRHLIAFTISAVIVILLLAVPLRFNYRFKENKPFIKVELSKVKPEIKQIETIKPKPIEKPKKSITQPKVETKVVQPKENKPKAVTPKIISTKPKSPKIIVQKPLPTSTVIFNSAYGKVKLNPIDKDFQVPTENAQDFKFKSVKPHKIYQVANLINEEIDKPQYEMNFYSMGLEGSVERLFDKITYEKKFTTKYGTKIACKGVGPLIMCGWK